MRVSRVLIGVCLALGGFSGCGPQTDYKEKSATVKATSKITATGGKLLSNNGSEVVVPAGALAVGAELSFGETTPPAEFAKITAAAASLPVEVGAIGADGQPVLQAQQALTVSISLDGTSLALLADKTEANLCVVMRARNASLFVWRKAELAHDAAQRKVSVSTLYLGIFQVFYCGQDAMPGFVDSKEQSAAAQVSGGTSASVEMTVPGAWAPTRNVAKHCLSIVDNVATADGDELSVLGIAEAEATGAAAVLLAKGLKPRPGAKEVFALLHLQAAGVPCALGLGAKLGEFEEFVGAVGTFAWQLDMGVLAAGGTISGTIGSAGPFPTATIDIGVGAPGFEGEAALQNVTEPIVCVDLDVEGGAKTMLPVNLSFASGVGRVGPEALYRPTVAVPASGLVLAHTLTLRVGANCQRFEIGAQNATTGKPYETRFRGAALLPSYHFAPVAMRIVSSNPLVASMNGCINVSPSGATDDQSWGEISVALAGGAYPILLPFSPANTSYDLRVDVLAQGKTCRDGSAGKSAFPSVPVANRPLTAEILVELK